MLPFSQYLAATTILPLSKDLSIPNNSYKWSYITCGLLWLTSLTQDNVSKVYSCCSTYKYLIPSYIWIIVHILLIHSLVDGHLGCFQFLAIMINSAMNILVQIFVWLCGSDSHGYCGRQKNAPHQKFPCSNLQNLWIYFATWEREIKVANQLTLR